MVNCSHVQNPVLIVIESCKDCTIALIITVQPTVRRRAVSIKMRNTSFIKGKGVFEALLPSKRLIFYMRPS